jgi:hypothetical protein
VTVAIEFEGAEPMLWRFESALQAEGLSVTLQCELRESRGVQTAVEIVKIVVYAGFEFGKPLALDVAQHVKDHGIDAGLLYVAHRVMNRLEERDPKVKVKIIERGEAD